jgi:hypothetical protein
MTPILHLNPVFAAESGGVRELAKGLVPTLPVERPAGLGLTFLRGMVEADPVRGIVALVQLALSRARAGEALEKAPARPAIAVHATPVEGGVP